MAKAGEDDRGVLTSGCIVQMRIHSTWMCVIEHGHLPLAKDFSCLVGVNGPVQEDVVFPSQTSCCPEIKQI